MICTDFCLCQWLVLSLPVPRRRTGSLLKAESVMERSGMASVYRNLLLLVSELTCGFDEVVGLDHGHASCLSSVCAIHGGFISESLQPSIPWSVGDADSMQMDGQ